MSQITEARIASLKLSKIGRVAFEEDGSITCDYFEAPGASCREVAILALRWARDRGVQGLDGEIDALMERPGGTGRVGVD